LLNQINSFTNFANISFSYKIILEHENKPAKWSKIVHEGWVIDYFALALGMNAQLKEL